MRSHESSNPPLEALEEGDIIRTEDGFLFICVPDPQSVCQKALTDGECWVNDGDMGVDYRYVPPVEYPLVIQPDRLEVLRFLLKRAQDHVADVSFYGTFYRLACYVSRN